MMTTTDDCSVSGTASGKEDRKDKIEFTNSFDNSLFDSVYTKQMNVQQSKEKKTNAKD